MVDLDLEVFAIARKPKLAPTSRGVAHQLARLLNAPLEARPKVAEFEVGEIKDPRDLTYYIEQATYIRRFWVTFSRPNPIDVEELFVKPFQRFADEAGARQGKAELKGDALKPETLKQVVSSAARTGDDASATLKIAESDREITKRLAGNPVTFSQEDLVDHEAMEKAMKLMRDLYEGIR